MGRSPTLHLIPIVYNGGEIVGLFMREKVWLKNSLSQSEGGGTGRGQGRVREEKQDV